MKQLTLRQRTIHARNKAMGPAMVYRPLRYIKNVSGRFSFLSGAAKDAAKRGDGSTVKDIARALFLLGTRS